MTRYADASRRHLVAAAAALALTVAAPGAEAKPGCPLLSDDAGDAKNISKPIADDPALDFVSADLVSDKTRLTVVMRVVAIAHPSPGTAAGATYDFGFALNGATYALRASYRVGTPNEFTLFTETRTDLPNTSIYEWTPTPARVDGVFDEDLAEIRMSLRLAEIPSEPAPGHRAGSFVVRSYMDAQRFVAAGADVMHNTASYVLGRRGCIPVQI